MTDTDNHFNLLSDPLIEVTDNSGGTLFSDLPTVLERLGRNDDIDFPGLQAHHQHPWHAFLVQLAGLALLPQDELPQDEASPEISADDWRTRLLALTPDASAWCLVVGDLARPAFMQPPVPEGSLAKLKNVTLHPDKLDILVTAKNHEVKAETISADDPLTTARSLLTTLITYQTFNGFSGRGNYGVARMNGGFASRPAVCVATDLRWATRFRRDLKILQAQRAETIEAVGFAKEGGHALLWLLPWQGGAKEILRIPQLDPWCLEICRRVRATLEGGKLLLSYGSTDAARIDAKARLGNLGDPWTPIRRKDGAALTLSENGFHYRLITDLLIKGDLYFKAPAQRLLRDEPDTVIAIFMALVRGQGKTGGYHERYLPIPSHIGEAIRQDGKDLSELAEVAQERIGIAADAQRKVLKPALLALLQGGTDKLNFKDGRAQPWIDRLDREVDRIFFKHLFDDAGQEPEAQDIRWHSALWHLCKALFDEAVDVLPRNLARAPAAIAQASSLFHFKARAELPSAFLKPEGSSGDEPEGSSDDELEGSSGDEPDGSSDDELDGSSDDERMEGTAA